RLTLDGLAVALLRVQVSSVLMQRDAALVPELWTLRLSLVQTVVHRERRVGVATQQMHLRHRLLDEVPILAALQRETILAEGCVIARFACARDRDGFSPMARLVTSRASS